MNKDEIIEFISLRSNKYGDKLVDFMERYGVCGLREATEAQLQEYIKQEFMEVAV